MAKGSLRFHVCELKWAHECGRWLSTTQTILTCYKGNSALDMVVGLENVSVTYISSSTTLLCSGIQLGFQRIPTSPGWIWPLCVSGKWRKDCCCSVTNLCLTLCDPMDSACQASLSFTISQSLLKLMSLSWWCHPTISSSVVPFSFCLQSFPASGSFPMSRLFASRGQSIWASASASTLSMSTQDWFPLGLASLISLQSKGLSRVFSNTIVQKHQFFGAQLSLWSNSYIHTWLLEKPKL